MFSWIRGCVTYTGVAMTRAQGAAGRAGAQGPAGAVGTKGETRFFSALPMEMVR